MDTNALTHQKRFTKTAFLLVIMLAGISQSRVTPARAAFPGANGKIAFVSDRDGNREIYVMEPDGSNPIRLTNYEDYDRNPAWSPDGTKIAFSRIIDLTTQQIFVMDADGGNQTPLAEDGPYGLEPSWSPDGTQIAFSGSTPGSFVSDIWVINSDGNNPINLTNDVAADDGAPAWSPNGTKIAFVSNREGEYDIYIMNPDGSDPVNLTNNSDGSDGGPSWSPDGKQIAFSRGSGEDGSIDLYVMNSDRTGQVKLADDLYDPAWSPDGTKILAASTDGEPGIFVMDANGENPVNLTNNEFFDDYPDWQRLPYPFNARLPAVVSSP